MPRLRRATLAAVAAFPALSLSACKPHQDADPRTADRLVEVATVQAAGDIERTYTGVRSRPRATSSGPIPVSSPPRVQSDLGFRVQGKVVERLGRYRPDRNPGPDADAHRSDRLHACRHRPNRGCRRARARWVQAASDEKRYRGLVASGAVSQITYDQAKAAADSTRALLSAAEAQEKVARNQGDYSVLLAGADGTVVETLAEPGQVVAPGQTVIRLAQAGPREAAVNLPETERPEPRRPGAGASLYGGAVHVPAHLRQLSDAADPRTRTFEARYVLDGDGAKAPLGATVTLSLPSAHPVPTIQVPLGAIDDEGHGPGLWVVNPKNFQVKYRPVTVQQFGGENRAADRRRPAGRANRRGRRAISCTKTNGSAPSARKPRCDERLQPLRLSPSASAG